MKYIDSLRTAMESMLEKGNLWMIGEDIQDPYGGSFKVTKSFSSKYPNQIIATPMSEQGFTGMGIGMSYLGCNVVVEAMFGDFITLMCDQMINHAAKFYQMYQQPMHIVIRCPSGGYRGYGATHSQSLEKLMMGIPGIQVIAPSIAHDPGNLLECAVESGVPTLFVENKLDYARNLLEQAGPYWKKEMIENGKFPTARISCTEGAPSITIVTYGGMVPMAMEVMKYFLYEEEINIDLVVVSALTSLNSLAQAVRTSKTITLEEGVKSFGWGSEVACQLAETGIRCRRIGAKDSFIPVSQSGEEDVLPSIQGIVDCIYKEVHGE